MTIRKFILATALAGASAIGLAAPASAQVSGIASANPVVAMGNSKAFNAINQQIQTMFKANLDQADAKERQRQQLLVQLDKNGDKNVDQDELDAAATAKNPALTQIGQIESEIGTLTEPASRAQAYGIEQMVKAYNIALKKVVTDRKVSVVLAPSSFVYAPDSADITDAITAELDKAPPAAVTAPPSNWQPSRDVSGLQQQLGQYQQILRIIAAQQRPPAGAAPAAGARPAGTAPARPAGTPAPAPARPAPQPR